MAGTTSQPATVSPARSRASAGGRGCRPSSASGVSIMTSSACSGTPWARARRARSARSIVGSRRRSMFVSGPSKRRSSQPVRSTNSPARLAWSACRWLSTSVRMSGEARAGHAQRPLEPFEAEPDGRAAVQQRVAVEQEDVDAARARIGQRQPQAPQPAEVVRAHELEPPLARCQQARVEGGHTRYCTNQPSVWGIDERHRFLPRGRDRLGHGRRAALLSRRARAERALRRLGQRRDRGADLGHRPGPGAGRVPQRAGKRRRGRAVRVQRHRAPQRLGAADGLRRRALLPVRRRRRGAARPHDLDWASARARARW